MMELELTVRVAEHVDWADIVAPPATSMIYCGALSPSVSPSTSPGVYCPLHAMAVPDRDQTTMFVE